MSTPAILYVEDEETDVVLLQHVFAKAVINNPLRVAKDGKEAKDYLSGAGRFENRMEYPLPALVLLDLNLPYWSGFQVLEWIRQQAHLRRLPVVVFTSSSRPDDIVRAYDVGANAYLVKPNALGDLLAQVTSLRDFWLRQNRFPGTLGGPVGASSGA